MSEPNEESTKKNSTTAVAAPTTMTHSSSSSSSSTPVAPRDAEEMLSKRRKEIFGDCALIEIIHLHDCLRGALRALEADVDALVQVVSWCGKSDGSSAASSSDPAKRKQRNVLLLERRVTGRFKVIWSVFKSHSHAEDEFIWPALKTKTQGRIGGSPKYNPSVAAAAATADKQPQEEDSTAGSNENKDHQSIEQEEYEEDHADEERMFSEMDAFLTRLREQLTRDAEAGSTSTSSSTGSYDMAKALSQLTHNLSQHLMAHLEKEETQCMPLVIKHLSKQEIHHLVGQIMGQRSASTITEIMTMAVQNLDEADREEMVKYMKQSMAGTFFDRWLTMSGWNGSVKQQQQHQEEQNASQPQQQQQQPLQQERPACQHCAGTSQRGVVGGPPIAAAAAAGVDYNHPDDERKRAALPKDEESHAQQQGINKKIRLQQPEDHQDAISQITEASAAAAAGTTAHGISTTSQAELEKLIRAVASNPSLTPAQKNTTIQGLRDSVWKSNQREQERNTAPPTVVNVAVGLPAAAVPPTFPAPANPNTANVTTGGSAGPVTSASSRTRRVTPPSMYFKKNAEGKIEIVWTSSQVPSSMAAALVGEDNEHALPLFSAAELAPSYHDGAAGAVLGCPHYARACKLRHPKSGRLYTCRLCCEQQREMPMKDADEPLDRYAVTEVMCMKCNALQPAEDRCINSDCESRGKPFAKYFCRICHLYDDGSRPIFHCPYCNTCRLGLGLGIDFRHCMRCNACVSLSDDDHHCIPQKLQGSCPICHESLFQSTEPLRGLKCGHVMHLSCFTEYRRGHAYTCPLCMRSMEDMDDYFALLDTAVRMQPMPQAYLSTFSNVYCQDCCVTGRTPYHFVGQKCPHCGSYNTREMGRVHNSPSSSPTAADSPV